MLFDTLHLSLFRAFLFPVELRIIIANFAWIPITTLNIFGAVQEELRPLKYGPIEYWDTSEVRSMGFSFTYTMCFNEDISRWNVSNVENMDSMFESQGYFNHSLENWDVSNVRSMHRVS